MADFSFVSTARFRPFSYQEMLQPIQAYTQEFNTVQEGMGELAAKADVYKNIANQQTDPETYAMYKKYADDLTAQVNSFADDGLTPGSRQGLLDMKRRYASEITPIELAFQAKKERSKEWLEMKAKDGTLMSDIDPSVTSLDAFLKNPNLTPRFYSGKAIHDTVFQSAQQLARNVESDEEKWRSILGGMYYEGLKRNGFKAEEVMAAIQGNPKARKEFQQIVDDAIDAAGVKEWATEDQMKRFYNHGYQGLWGAIGDAKFSTLANPYAKPTKGSNATPNSTFSSNRVAVGTRRNEDYKEHSLDNISFLRDDKGNIVNVSSPELRRLEAQYQTAMEAANIPRQNIMGRPNANVSELSASNLAIEINKIRSHLNSLYKDYDLIQDNPLANMQRAQGLERAQSAEQLYANPIPFANPKVVNDIATNVETALATGKSPRAAFKYEDGRKGKAIDYEDALEFIRKGKKDGGNLGLAFAAGVGTILTNNKGESIVLNHDMGTQRIQARAEATNEFLRTFKGIKNIIKAEDLNNIDMNDGSAIAKLASKGVQLGNDLYGLHVRIGNGNIKNIVVDLSNPNDIVWYDSSVEDEINNGGRGRQASSEAQIRTDFLRHFQKMFGNKMPSSSLSSKQSWVVPSHNEYYGNSIFQDTSDDEDE